MKKWPIILVIFASCGCSSKKTNQIPARIKKLKKLTVYSSKVKPEKTISFKREDVYGNSNKVLIGNIRDIAVDSSGRVFIADSKKLTIDVFEPDGQFLTQLGRNGKGPEEFVAIKSIQIRNNNLYAYDSWQGEVSIFPLNTLSGGNTILLAGNRRKYTSLNEANPMVNNLYVRNNNTYLAEFISDAISKKPQKWQNYESKGLFFLLNKTGYISSRKLFDFTYATRTAFVEPTYHVIEGLNLFYFFGHALTVLSSNNTIYWAGPEYFLIKIYSSNGTYLRAIYYPHPKIPLTEKSATKGGVPNYFVNTMKFMKLPKDWPVLTRMKIDDKDRLWVATTVQNMKVYQWWVLNSNDGKLIARFKWPRDKPIKVVRAGYIYTQETDTMTEISKVVRYRITMKLMGKNNQ